MHIHLEETFLVDFLSNISDYKIAKIIHSNNEAEQKTMLEDCQNFLSSRYKSILWEYHQIIANEELEKELGEKIPHKVIDFLKSLPHEHREKIVATTINCFNDIALHPVETFLADLLALAEDFKITRKDILLARFIAECLPAVIEAHPYSLVSKDLACKILKR